MALCSRCVGIYLGVVLGCSRALLSRRAMQGGGVMAIVALVGNGMDFFMEWAAIYGNLPWLRLILGLALGWFAVEFARKR